MPPLICLLLLASVISGGDSALRFAASYGDHMVLQASPYRAVIWGHVDNDNVTVSVFVKGHETAPVYSISSNGIWKVQLPAWSSSSPEAPYTITATSSEGNASIHDVLFGDVWVCSGQSNMGVPMSWINNTAYEINKALAFDKIRIFQVHSFESSVPLTDLHSIQTKWTAPTKETVPGFSALCLLYAEYIYTHRKQPIGLIETEWGGTSVEAWSGPDVLKECEEHKAKRGPQAASVLWNSMVIPLLPQTIYGAIWYQGESNTHNSDQYACLFPSMIKDWRLKFHQASMGATNQNFPFGFVQLAGNQNDSSRIAGFPAIRWSQTAKYGYAPNPKMPYTFMAVAMDLPDFKSPHGFVHPRYKQDVAERLGLAGLAVAYGEKGLSYQGPYPTSFNTKTKDQLVIEYNHGHTVLDVRSNNGFEICCSPSTHPTTCAVHDHWAPAPMSAHHGTTVTLNTTGCHPKWITGLRYAWRESPCEFKKCAVYGKENDLPAPPFIKYIPF